MPKSDIVIGLDFDNTLVSYDEVMRQTALDLGFMRDDQDVSGKEQVRDFIRSLSSGEIKWQVLQAEVYGKRMSQVCLIDGVKQFLLACKDAHVQTFIVSHKSKHAAQDKEGINLQEVALSWMREQYFFDKKGLGLSEDRVYFEETRGKKVNRIKELACTHFIDDLKEVFLEN